jgi:hypothetical protein
MSLVIVTDKCYLLCESINYMSLNEGDSDTYYEEVKLKLRKSKGKIMPLTSSQRDQLENFRIYSLTIDFIPSPTANSSSSNSSRNSETATVSITLRGKAAAEALFSDVVGQIREQIPDHKFLNELAERFLTDFHESEK